MPDAAPTPLSLGCPSDSGLSTKGALQEPFFLELVVIFHYQLSHHSRRVVMWRAESLIRRVGRKWNMPAFAFSFSVC